jgi:ABC-type uncharacterized transport system permease subunit
MAKKEYKKFQEITDEIAKKHHLQTSSKQFADPIYQTHMQGIFLRSLKKYPHTKNIKKVFSILAFILPSLISLSLLIKSLLKEKEINYNIFSISFLITILYLIVGVKIYQNSLK